MHALRYLTLVWPGLPWLWLRGSLSGLVLAVAFAAAVDMAILSTFIWPRLVELPLTLGLWTAVAVLWLVSTVSAAATFPPPISPPRHAEADASFLKARDAYLARDWVQAEAHLQDVLSLAPTDGEAQLLHATLLRRIGRPDEARAALEKLARSDSGRRWHREISAEIRRLAGAAGGGDASPDSVILPLRDESGRRGSRSAAA